MSSNFEALYGEEVYANLIIECENRQFKVHKVVICTASSIIAKMFDPRNNMKESTSNVIKHEQFDAAILQRMIEFAYRGAYTVEVVRPHDSMSNDEGYTNEHADTQPVKVLPRDIKDFSASRLRLLVAHAYAYAIADYYEFVAMKVTAEDSSLDTMPYGWDASEPARLLELIVTIAQITAQGDKKGIRHETVDFTVHMLRHLKDDATFFSALVNSEEPAVQVLAKEIFQWSASRFQSCHDDKAYWCKREKKARQNNIKLREELKSNGLQHIKNINDLRAQKDKEMADAVTGVSAVFTKQIAEVERVEFESDARANEDANKLRQLAEKLRATRKDLDKLSSFIEDLPETCSNRKCSSKPLLFDIQRKRNARNVLMPAIEDKTVHGEFAVYLLPNRST
ncbi:hypothetical protein B0A48_14784 [Cryoendolithus antarcticus]|uniref:BTB domain-containing protein n=1 Tax=Cryoendolithus antarcticus TaxID=1507870 RepID=A0A1V8SKI0_9PEZI|nr:hypothetical protein B0A48_14784 [Cryoendolithus antarcticus]